MAPIPQEPRIAVIAPAPMRGDLVAALAAEGLAVAAAVESVAALECRDGHHDAAVIVADLRHARSAALLRRLRERCAVDRVVLVRTGEDGHAVRRALEAGIDGMVGDDRLGEALGPTVRAVLAGQLAVPGSIRARLAPPALSHRERQVLALVVDGCTNSEIAQRLFLAESTVKSHLATAFAKLGVRSRRDATAMILGADILTAAVLPAGPPAPPRRMRARAA